MVRFALAITASSLLFAADALACSCSMPPPPDRAFEVADAVFIGRVSEREAFRGGWLFRVTFTEVTPFKGPKVNELEDREGGRQVTFPNECSFAFSRRGRRANRL